MAAHHAAHRRTASVTGYGASFLGVWRSSSAFVGGAGGAILSPWITHHLSGRSRLAERRQQPYAHMLEAARELVSVTKRRITGEAAQSSAVRAFDKRRRAPTP
jgi:hypothetical protein